MNTSMATPTDPRITASGIARLARVKRPVVTVWRRRFASGDGAFPPPVARDGATDLFAASDVARWLVDTAHGNNPNAVEDAALFASNAGLLDLDALTALLALRVMHGEALGGLSADDLLDLADALDPDDEMLFSELEVLGERSPGAARRVDDLVEAAYTPTAVLDQLIAEHVRDGGSAAARAVLVPDASALISEIAIELALTNEQGDASAPCFVDPTGVGGDRLVDLVARLDELAEVSIVAADVEGAAARLLRRRLCVLGVARSGLQIGVAGEFEVHGSAVHVAQYPTSAGSLSAPIEILDAIDQIALQMSDAQRGVVVAPAGVLIEGGLDREAARRRAEVLRSGRVRAIVALPPGLVVAQPRQRLALWMLGPVHGEVPLAERRTLVVDLTATRLDAGVRADLVGDLAASMGGPEVVRAHAFSGPRLLPTRRLLARSGSLLDDPAPVAHTPSTEVGQAARAVPAQFDRALAALGDTALPALESVKTAASIAALPGATLGELAGERHVRCIGGSRIEATDVASDGGYTVVGVEELGGRVSFGSRRIDRLLLADRYPAAKLTEPGDVVFAASPSPQAWVDREGASVVVAPARVLRVNRADPAGLVADVLAADIGAQPERSSDWRSWRVRRVLPDEALGLAAVLRGIRAEIEATRRRVEHLHEVQRLVVAGVTAGTLTTTERNP